MPRDPEHTTRQGFPKAGPSGRIRNDLEALRPPRPGPRLTARDVDVLRWITRHGIVTADQIGAAYFPSKWAAYKRLKALDAMGLIRRDAAWHRAPKVIRVSPAGARVADIGVKEARLSLAQVPHDVAVVDLCEYLLAHNKGATLQTERELRVAQYRTTVKGRGAMARTPDGVLTLKDGTTVAFELDLTHKDSRTVDSVVRAYERQTKQFAKMWWFVDGHAAAERYARVVKQRKADDFITVHEWTA